MLKNPADRIPYGLERTNAYYIALNQRHCDDCDVARGQYHEIGCSVEQCSICLRHRLTCKCRVPIEEEETIHNPQDASAGDKEFTHEEMKNLFRLLEDLSYYLSPETAHLPSREIIGLGCAEISDESRRWSNSPESMRNAGWAMRTSSINRAIGEMIEFSRTKLHTLEEIRYGDEPKIKDKLTKVVEILRLRLHGIRPGSRYAEWPNPQFGDRIPFGMESFEGRAMRPGQITCIYCHVPKGEYHNIGCPGEQCGTCKRVRAFCECKSSRTGNEIIHNPGSRPKINKLFAEVSSQVKTVFPDFNPELIIDKSAYGFPRNYAFCIPDEHAIHIAPQAEDLPDDHLKGILFHECGHLLTMQYDLDMELPEDLEEQADFAIFRLFGIQIHYDPKKALLQCIRDTGISHRPRGLR